MLIFSWLLYQKWIFSNVDSCSCSSRSESLKRLSWFVLWLQVYHQLHSTGSRQPAAHLSPARRDDRTLLLCGRHHLCRDVGADVCRWSWQQVRLMAVRRLRGRIQIQALWGGWTRKHNNTRTFVRTGSGFMMWQMLSAVNKHENIYMKISETQNTNQLRPWWRMCDRIQLTNVSFIIIYQCFKLM